MVIVIILRETQVSRGTDRSSVFGGRKRLKERELGSPYGVKGAKSPTSGENNEHPSTYQRADQQAICCS